ncbi:MAG: hypothetical protein JXR73_12270 [Candidatus Omnitrophica bacterium]|nr:hypothetical protein [Candidatus Omnitrophota bacterium]
MLTRQRIDSLVICIAGFAAVAILLVFLACDSAEAADQPRKARLTGGQAIDRAAQAWKPIYDYQTILHQMETHPSGEVKQFWARVQMVRPTEDHQDLESSFLLELFDHPISRAANAPEDATPSKIYFADASQLFYTINPEANTIIIENLNERTSPLPEFMYLAGFLDFDIETFKEKAYIDSDVFQETIHETETYRIHIQPRKEKRDVEPPRYLWIDRKTSLPEKFTVDADVRIDVLFTETRTNQGLKSEELMPQVREDAVIDYRTQ